MPLAPSSAHELELGKIAQLHHLSEHILLAHAVTLFTNVLNYGTVILDRILIITITTTGGVIVTEENRTTIYALKNVLIQFNLTHFT